MSCSHEFADTPVCVKCGSWVMPSKDEAELKLLREENGRLTSELKRVDNVKNTLQDEVFLTKRLYRLALEKRVDLEQRNMRLTKANRILKSTVVRQHALRIAARTEIEARERELVEAIRVAWPHVSRAAARNPTDSHVADARLLRALLARYEEAQR